MPGETRETAGEGRGGKGTNITKEEFENPGPQAELDEGNLLFAYKNAGITWEELNKEEKEVLKDWINPVKIERELETTNSNNLRQIQEARKWVKINIGNRYQKEQLMKVRQIWQETRERELGKINEETKKWIEEIGITTRRVWSDQQARKIWTNKEDTNVTRKGSLPKGTPVAGQQRCPAPAETKHEQARARNTNRGLRGQDAIEVRKWKRTCKRRMARQQHRITSRATAQYSHVGRGNETISGARGVEPKIIKRSNDVATLNVRTLVEKHKVPIVVTGFEPLDLVQGLYMTVKQLEAGSCKLENQYARVVKEQGNKAAITVIQKVFEVGAREWRGIGEIPNSGYVIKPAYKKYDAEAKFKISNIKVPENAACIAGEILRGIKKPNQCPQFGKACKPSNPLGAPMVSSEGACAAYYHFSNN